MANFHLREKKHPFSEETAQWPEMISLWGWFHYFKVILVIKYRIDASTNKLWQCGRAIN